jgi:hypothetical protein
VRNQVSDAEHDAEEGRAGGRSNTTPRFWFSVAADHATIDSNSTSPATANVGGSGGGVDFHPASNLLMGGGAGLSLGGMSLSEVSGSSTMTAPRAFGYSGLGFGPFHLHGGGSASRVKTSTQRNINFQAFVKDENGNLVPLSNGVNRDADGNENATLTDTWTELQSTQKFRGYTMDTKIGFRAARLTRDAFSETGADSISLAGAADTFHARESHVEWHLFRKTGNWRPNILVNYRRESGDDTTKADVAFEGAPNSQFPVQGVTVPVNNYQGLFGLSIRTFSGLIYTFEYETQQSSTESHHAVHFRVKFK